MAGSVSQQLEELLNPLPKFADPEDDQEDETKAQVEDRFDEDDDDEDHEDGFGLSNLRKHNASLLAETDRRYVGKAVSRKQLLKDMGVSEEGEGEEDDGEDEDGMTETKGEEEEEEDDDEDEEDDDEEVESGDDVCDDIGASGDEKQTQDGTTNGTVKALVSKMKRTDFVCAEKVDLHKLTEGMDDLGESDEDDDDDDEDGEEDDDDDSEEEETEDENEDQGTVKTFSKEKVDVEVEKGKAVKNQLMLWDQLLEGRIKLQKALATANQLPQPQTFPEFKQRGGAEFAGALKNSHKALKALQRSLLELQDQLLHQNPDTRPISLGKTYGAVANGDDEDDEEEEEEEMEVGPAAGSGALKRKLDVVQYPGFMAKRFADFQPYCNGTLQKWHDKTRLTMGKSSKGFGAFERNIVTQVEQVLLDKERLLRRTQTRRTEYRVLGKKEPSSAAAPDEPAAPPEDGEEAAASGEEQLLKANRHLKDLDEDIFDDDDFYHQLLRELIERKTSTADPNDQVAMGRQWLAIQKLRSKIKKRVDTKASKGRKVRFTIHSKLVNFMAPVDHSPMNDESRTELFRCLFGNNSPLEGSEVNVV